MDSGPFWQLIARQYVPDIALGLRSRLDSTDSLPGIVPPVSM